MSPLTALHQRLASFRHRRQRLRWGMAWSAFLCTGLIALGGLFAADVGFQLSVFQRVVVLALGLAAVAWGTNRFVRPWLGVRETETDVALFVEREHGIDSDLVAALQFDRRGGTQWGSVDLQSAVIDRVAQLGAQLDLTHDVDYRPLARRGRILAAVVVAWGIVVALFPRHVGIFGQRLLLSSRHYPTATQVQRIAINGSVVWESGDDERPPRSIRLAKNRPVSFLVRGSGVLPESGLIECRAPTGGSVRRLPLHLRTAPESATSQPSLRTASSAHPPADYLAELPRLVEPFSYSIRLGDCWTEPASVELIEPPVVTLNVVVTPPAYAAAADRAAGAGQRQVAVLQGSQVDLLVACINDKTLASATVRMVSGGETHTFSLHPSSKDPSQWALPAGTPLSSVAAEVRFEIEVTDRDGLGLESPLQGIVRIKVDRPPVVVAAMVHRVVLPTATPVVEFGLNDDFGIASAALHVQVERQPDSSSLSGESAAATEATIHRDIPLDPAPVIGQNLPQRGRFPLALAPLNLVPGDRLKLTLAVTDFRGDLPGQVTLSDPILLQITDEAGVLTAITEADERSDKRLEEVIKQQLDVGGNR